METRPINLQKQLISRTHGVIKKANELFKRYGVRAAIIVEDGSNEISYQSDPDWRPQFGNNFTDRVCYGPSDFMTVSEFQQITAYSGDFKSNHLHQTLSKPALDEKDDKDLELLQALGGYLNSEKVANSMIETAARNGPKERVYGYEAKNNLKRPLANCAGGLSAKKAKITSSKPITRSMAGCQDQDPYHFTS